MVRQDVQEFWNDGYWAKGTTNWKILEDAEWPFESNLEFAGVQAGPGTRALVPLCGDSAVVPWLAKRGVEVVAVEGAELACAALKKRILEVGGEEAAARVRILQGDFFEVMRTLDEGCVDFVYDRASLVAIDPSTRASYAALLNRVSHPGTVYFVEGIVRPPQTVSDGPPFHLEISAVEQLYTPLGWYLTTEGERRKHPETGSLATRDAFATGEAWEAAEVRHGSWSFWRGRLVKA